jgi:hypothetical protein
MCDKAALFLGGCVLLAVLWAAIAWKARIERFKKALDAL